MFCLTDEEIEILDALAKKLKCSRSEALREALRSIVQESAEEIVTLAKIKQLEREITQLRKTLDEIEQQISHLKYSINEESDKQSIKLFGKTHYYKCEDGILRTAEQIAEYILSIELKKVKEVLGRKVIMSPLNVREFLHSYVRGLTEDELNELTDFICSYIEKRLKERNIEILSPALSQQH
jgi:Arc/MetJ-type ribon-helix-helix transcriptional regulator